MSGERVCPFEGKTIHASPGDATRKSVAARGQRPTTVYRCQFCGGFHVSNRPRVSRGLLKRRTQCFAPRDR